MASVVSRGEEGVGPDLVDCGFLPPGAIIEIGYCLPESICFTGMQSYILARASPSFLILSPSEGMCVGGHKLQPGDR
jgi:hypothetical protein